VKRRPRVNSTPGQPDFNRTNLTRESAKCKIFFRSFYCFDQQPENLNGSISNCHNGSEERNHDLHVDLQPLSAILCVSLPKTRLELELNGSLREK
jgi:hypothetical protein